MSTSLDPVPEAPPPPASLDETWVSGTGALVDEEKRLLGLLQSAIAHAEGRQASNIARILWHQSEMVRENLRILDRCQARFPVPLRFESQEAGDYVPAVRKADENSEFLSPYAELVYFHRKIRQQLTRLEELDSTEPTQRPLLREAAQRHDEMVWMLNSLAAEDGLVGLDRSRFPAPLPPTEGAWENEGEATVPPETLKRDSVEEPKP